MPKFSVEFIFGIFAKFWNFKTIQNEATQVSTVCVCVCVCECACVCVYMYACTFKSFNILAVGMILTNIGSVLTFMVPPEDKLQ